MGAKQSTSIAGDVLIEPPQSSTTDEDETRSVHAHAIDCCSIASSYQSLSELDDFLKQGDPSLNRWSVRSLPVLSELMTNPIYEGDELNAVAEEAIEETTTERADPNSGDNATPAAPTADTSATETLMTAPVGVSSAGWATEPSAHLPAALVPEVATTAVSATPLSASASDAVNQADDTIAVPPATCTAAFSEATSVETEPRSLSAAAATHPACTKTEDVVNAVTQDAMRPTVKGAAATVTTTQLVITDQEPVLTACVNEQPKAPADTSDDDPPAAAKHETQSAAADTTLALVGGTTMDMATRHEATPEATLGAARMDPDSQSPQEPQLLPDGLSATETTQLTQSQSSANLASPAIADDALIGAEVAPLTGPRPTPPPPAADATFYVDVTATAANTCSPPQALYPPVAVDERLRSHHVVDAMPDSSEWEEMEDEEENDIGLSGGVKGHACRRASPSGTSSTAKTLVYAPGDAGSPVPAAAAVWRRSATGTAPSYDVAAGRDIPVLDSDSPEVAMDTAASSAGEGSGSGSETSAAVDAMEAVGKGLQVPAGISTAPTGAGAGEKCSTVNAMHSAQHANGKMSNGGSGFAKGVVAVEPLGMGAMGDMVLEQKKAKGQGVTGGDKTQHAKAGGVFSCFTCFSGGR